MEAQQFIETIAAVLVANIITVWLFYGFWRTTKDDSLKSIAIALVPCLLILAIGIAAKMGQ